MGKHLGKCNSVGRGRPSAKALAMAAGDKRRKLRRDDAAEISSYLQLRSRALVLMPLPHNRRRRRSPSMPPPCEKPEVVDSGAGAVDVERAASLTDTNCSGEAAVESQEQMSRSNWVGQEDQVEEEEGCLESNSCNFAQRCNSVERNRRRRERTPSSALRGDDGEVLVEFDNLEARNETSAGRPTRTKPSQMPSVAEIEEFFAAAEREQTKKFMEKYNYDVVKDEPVEGGQYEWVKISQ